MTPTQDKTHIDGGELEMYTSNHRPGDDDDDA